MSASLQSLKVLVTRPQPQNQGLLALIQAHGGQALACPLIQIQPEAIDIDRLIFNEYDFLIFTSINAVTPLESFLDSASTQSCLVAIGQATAKALAPHNVLIAPRPNTSEALLTLPEFQKIKQQRVLLIKGHGGRQVLREELTKRGARVDELLVYRRQPIDYTNLNELKEFDCAVVTSTEIIKQFYRCFVEMHGLNDVLKRPLLVIGQRQADYARELMFTQLLVAQSAADDAILNQLLQWREEQ